MHSTSIFVAMKYWPLKSWDHSYCPPRQSIFALPVNITVCFTRGWYNYLHTLAIKYRTVYSWDYDYCPVGKPCKYYCPLSLSIFALPVNITVYFTWGWYNYLHTLIMKYRTVYSWDYDYCPVGKPCKYYCPLSLSIFALPVNITVYFTWRWYNYLHTLAIKYRTVYSWDYDYCPVGKPCKYYCPLSQSIFALPVNITVYFTWGRYHCLHMLLVYFDFCPGVYHLHDSGEKISDLLQENKQQIR